MTIPGCPGLLDPVCQAVGGAGSTIVGLGAGAVFGDLASWVAGGAGWLLDQVGAALSASTSIDLSAGWFTAHYEVMVGIAAAVALPVLLLSIMQAVYRQNAAALVRSALLQLPLALLLTAVAVQLVQLSLAVTDALCSVVSSGAGATLQQELSDMAAVLVGGTPQVSTFVVFIAGLLLALGALALWFELLVRTAAVYVAVLFLPLALASMVWPAISHWARRLADTLAALVLSKFVIVVVLSLAVSALDSGGPDGLSSVFTGAALLFLAVFAPFVLLRIVPAVEAGAVHQLEGLRHRVVPSGPIPQSAARFALRHVRAASSAAVVPGTGGGSSFDAPGGDDGAASTGGSGSGSGSGAGGSGGAGGSSGGAGTKGAGRGPSGPGGIPMWRGGPAPDGVLADRPSGGSVGTHRGSPPLWGGPPSTVTTNEKDTGSPGSGSPASGSPDAADPAGDEFARRASLALAQDHMGPVIRWTPPGGRGDGVGAASATESDGARGSGADGQ